MEGERGERERGGVQWEAVGGSESEGESESESEGNAGTGGAKLGTEDYIISKKCDKRG